MKNESRKNFPRLFKLIICNPLLYFPFIIRHPWPSLFFLGLEGVDCWTNHAKDTFKTFKATYMHVTLRILNLCSCLELQKYIEPLIAFKVSKHCKYTSKNGSQVTACRLSRSLQINFKTYQSLPELCFGRESCEDFPKTWNHVKQAKEIDDR